MKMSRLLLPLLLTLPPVHSFSQKQEDTLDYIVRSMIASIGKIQSLTYTLRNTERFDGELISGMFSVKYTIDPKRCHFHMIRPDKGPELYYSEGRNDNLAVYDPKGFP